MKFAFGGVHVSTNVPHITDVMTAIKLGEELGFDIAFLSDRTRDTYINCAAGAMITRKIQIGPGVTNPYTRHPAVTARAIATLDELSGGRAVLGFGAGNMVEMTRDLGYETKKGYARVREALIVIKRLLKGETIDFEGEFFKVKGLKMGMSPHPNIPAYISAQGPRIMEVAGEVADVVMIPYTHPEILKMVLEKIRMGAEKAGRNFSDVKLQSWLPVYMTEHRSDIYETLRAYAALMVLLSPVEWLSPIGITPEKYDVIKKGYQKGAHVDAKLEAEYAKMAKEYINDTIVDTFVMAGKAQDLVNRVEELRKMGFSEFGFWVPTPVAAEKRRVMADFAEKIMPRFK
ncbi:MAG: LLM class flavin-dependent oxidoreductase [Thaumarchaeota archaeon]|nr:LLM class flavin-dependent oxidoreductase [Nitrososphaerota archaeon]